MKKFLLQILFFLFLLFLFIYWSFTKVDGTSDPYYLRFTTPKQTSLILGISKAAQGLQPSIFNKILNRNDIFNYSFTISRSPYGPTYLKSIKNKLKKDTKNGIFILTIDAWSLSSNTKDPNDSTNFSEVNSFLNNDFVNMNPNIPYLVKYYGRKYIDIFRYHSKNLFLHNNGWLEVSIPIDSISRKKRLLRNFFYYSENYVPMWKFSSVRFSYLSKTIEFLKKHGSVYLVRLPVHKKIFELENSIIPTLDEEIEKLSNKHNVFYLNYSDSNNNFIYTDGLHLWKESGTKLSREIATFILKHGTPDSLNIAKN